MTSRFYRKHLPRENLVSFEVRIKETDLWVAVDRNSYREGLKKELEEFIWKQRKLLEGFIEYHPEFQGTLEPYLVEEAPPLVFRMVRAGNCAGVGPMAAVAGVFAEMAGEFLLERGAGEVMVENGGDIFIKTLKKRVIGVFAGESSWSGKIGMEIKPSQTPLGICTSSGTVGPSFSRGAADAVVVVSSSVPLADAAATALGNEVNSKEDLPRVVEMCKRIEGIKGIVAICQGEMVAWGEVQLSPLQE